MLNFIGAAQKFSNNRDFMSKVQQRSANSFSNMKLEQFSHCSLCFLQRTHLNGLALRQRIEYCIPETRKTCLRVIWELRRENMMQSQRSFSVKCSFYYFSYEVSLKFADKKILCVMSAKNFTLFNLVLEHYPISVFIK